MENVKILICDDSILARKQLKDTITKSGYENFLEASNGQEAIDLYKEHKPDLVFVDIVMPIKDGVEAIHEIREFDPSAHVIVVSSVGKKCYYGRSQGFYSETFYRLCHQRSHTSSF